MKHKSNTILIGSGGTGGHVFPAQELAKELRDLGYEPIFIGGGLKTNRYFNREAFSFEEIESATPYRGNLLKALGKILRGVYQSWRLLSKYRPRALVGFGSFYTFPVLVAALIRRIPIFLFEPNAVCGKVNRLFSRWAQVSAVQFPEASSQLKGSCVNVKMPTAERQKEDKKVASAYFGLAPERFTFLVFGGSQGAGAINHLFVEAMKEFTIPKDKFQVIHLVGAKEKREEIAQMYEQEQILACVKSFEPHMEKGWSAADLVISRSGAATVAEQIGFAVPAILIPFPQATEDHQKHNAFFVEKVVHGGVVCLEQELSGKKLAKVCMEMIDQSRLDQMRQAIDTFKKGQDLSRFSAIIANYLRA